MSDKYNFSEKESYIRNFWEENFIYSFDPESSQELFSIDTPPPTVSGTLHIGHIFSYTQTDIIARYKRMMGKNVFYPFGFDNNGLPTERFVEKNRGISAHKVGREAFNQACLEETEKIQVGFVDLWKKMGLSVDWNYCYSTISKETQTVAQKSFIDLYEKGFIYKKEEPALYCTACRTSVAQADLEDVEKECWFSTLLFYTKNNVALEIATTRPELLASCVALFYHPDDIRYQKYEGTFAKVPFYNFEVIIKSDDRVIMDKGTGLVMCCTFGDTLDIYWFKKHSLPYKQSINFDGTMTEQTGPLKGLKVEAAREEIIKILEEQKVLINKSRIIHRVAIYERSKKEIEYVMLSQWFLHVLPYKQDLINAADEISWHPEHMKQRYIHWVENLQWDWCLSRQRSFGIPFPVWYDAKGNPVIAEENELPVDPQVIEKNGLVGDTDVMDTWNTSSLTPYICQNMLNKKDFSLKLPMSMRPQAHDIIRTWAFYTITKTWMHEKVIPWNNIVISGHVVTSQKEKISKSQGNNPADPLTLLKNYPADVIRYWTASSNLGIDTAFSDTQFKNGNRLLIKLFNAALFVKQYVISGCENNETGKTKEINKWIIEKLKKTQTQYHDYFQKYEFGLALSSIESFFWGVFCDNYLELIKNELQSPDVSLETRETLSYVFYEILKAYAPFISHITEFLYQDTFNKKDSLHKHIFTPLSQCENTEFETIIQAISLIRKEKTERKMSLKTEVDQIAITTSNKKNSEYLHNCIEWIAPIAQAKEIHIKIDESQTELLTLTMN